MVVDIWYNENNIKKKLIIVYSDCGISLKLDDSEDEMFRWPDIGNISKQNEEISNILYDLDEN